MATPISPRLAGIPLVRNSAERDALYPPTEVGLNQRVHNLASGTLQRWNGASWLDDFYAGALSTASPSILDEGSVQVTTPQQLNFVGTGVTVTPNGVEAIITIPGVAAPSSGVAGTVAFGALLCPDGSGAVSWRTSDVNNVNDLAPTSQVLGFNYGGAGLIAAYASGVPVPTNFDGTRATTVWLAWRCTVTTGAVVWEVKYRSIAVGESDDPATWQESLTATATTSGTARALNLTPLTMTPANLAARDTMLWMVGRDTNAVGDTLADVAEIVGVWYDY